MFCRIAPTSLRSSVSSATALSVSEAYPEKNVDTPLTFALQDGDENYYTERGVIVTHVAA